MTRSERRCDGHAACQAASTDTCRELVQSHAANPLDPSPGRVAKAMHRSRPMRAAAVLVLLASLSACKKPGSETDAKAPSSPPEKLDLVTAQEAPSPDELVL